MCVLSIKVPIRNKSGNLFNDPRIYALSLILRNIYSIVNYIIYIYIEWERGREREREREKIVYKCVYYYNKKWYVLIHGNFAQLW